MTPTNMTRSRGQVYSIGNYLMTGKVLGKGHFARVEEATHRIIGKKVAIKVIDLTCIKEEYARRNLHREPRVMARLRHPCIAALYETMMHGPRLYVVMEAAGGGDLCAHVLAARGPSRGLSESRARALACQLVSAVRHMHSRGVVHRDLKMENIMLDSTKQFIKIVDFGLSNLWSSGGALRTPCGSLEYAAPELFVDGRRYGPEVDLWSIGVIVYGIVTGGLPFTAPDSGGGGGGGGGKSRPQLRAAIARGFTRKQRAALACVSAECKAFIQHLLEPNVELRMKIEDAARHRWLRRPGMRMKTHPLTAIEPRVNREIYHQISDLCGETVMDVAAQIKADPFGALGGMYNIKTHLHQLQAVPGVDLLWSSTSQEPRPISPPEYKKAKYDERPETAPSSSKTLPPSTPNSSMYTTAHRVQLKPVSMTQPFQKLMTNGLAKPPGLAVKVPTLVKDSNNLMRNLTNSVAQAKIQPLKTPSADAVSAPRTKTAQSPRFNMASRPLSVYGIKKPAFKTIQNNGDCLDQRLPSIDEHSSANLNDGGKGVKGRTPPRTPCLRKISLEESPLRLSSCPAKTGEVKRTEFYRKAGDGLPSWKASGVVPTPTRLLLQSNATTIKRASLGNIVSPHSSTNSHCKSERSAPVGWYASRPTLTKEPQHLQRFRRTAPMK